MDHRPDHDEHDHHPDERYLGHPAHRVRERSLWSHLRSQQGGRGPSVSRRTVLRSAVASLALPWLPSLAWAGGGDDEVAAGPPRRWVCMIASNGVHPEHWWARGEGAAMELGASCQSLAPFKDDLLFINGLRLFAPHHRFKPHSPYFTNFLSGKMWTPSTVPDMAQSIDSFMGQTVGRATAIPHIVLGTEQDGTNTTMTWSSPTTPVQCEIYPGQAFDRLFDVQGLRADRSVLDGMLADAQRLRADLDTPDRHKLEEFMNSVREIETRIQRTIEDERAPGAWRPTLSEPDLERPPNEPPVRHDEHMRLMNDIMLLALRMDKTRIATVICEADVGGMTFEFLEGVNKQGIHSLSHSQNGRDPMYQRINEYHCGLLAEVLAQMRACEEGDGTLLDNTMLLYGSTMRNGNGHDWKDLPLVLCGGRNCDIRGGRVLNVEGEDDQYLCNLHLALAQRMGCTITEWGNSRKVMEGLV